MPAARIPLLAAYAMWYGVIFCSGGCGGAHLVLNLIRHHGDGEARGSGGADSGLRDHGDRGLEGSGRGEAESEGEHAEHLGWRLSRCVGDTTLAHTWIWVPAAS